MFEVDHPASQQDKRDRVGDLPPLARSLRYVPVDFTRDRLDVVLTLGRASALRGTRRLPQWLGTDPSAVVVLNG